MRRKVYLEGVNKENCNKIFKVQEKLNLILFILLCSKHLPSAF